MAKPMSHQDYERMQERISNGLKASAVSRQCPECKRKAAIKRVKTATGSIRQCRWCPYKDEHVLRRFRTETP